MSSRGSGEEAITRFASHAGSWYEKKGSTLSKQLQAWLDEAKVPAASAPRAVIAPHAGYAYSGPSAAWAYKYLAKEAPHVKRIVILGPSHHYYTKGCEVTQATVYATPVGDLRIDQSTIAELLRTEGKGGRDGPGFGKMDLQVDEDEHSIEMQLPYIAEIMRGRDDVSLVPILVGNLSIAKEQEYGQRLAPLLLDPSTFFVISSDFCHWGARFRYTYYDGQSEGVPIYKGIERLDRRGMAAIETQDPARFAAYLKETQNTICGRHPIAVMMHALATLRKGVSLGTTPARPLSTAIKFVHYKQSSQCTTPKDSSVSYASAVITIAEGSATGSSSSSAAAAAAEDMEEEEENEDLEEEAEEQEESAEGKR